MNAMTRAAAAVSKLTFPSYMDEEFDLILDSRRDLSIFCLVDDKTICAVTTIYACDGDIKTVVRDPGFQRSTELLFCLSSLFRVLWLPLPTGLSIFCLTVGPKPSPINDSVPLKNNTSGICWKITRGRDVRTAERLSFKRLAAFSSTSQWTLCNNTDFEYICVNVIYFEETRFHWFRGSRRPLKPRPGTRAICSFYSALVGKSMDNRRQK